MQGPDLNSMTQGNIFTPSFVTKKGAFCNVNCNKLSPNSATNKRPTKAFYLIARSKVLTYTNLCIQFNELRLNMHQRKGLQMLIHYPNPSHYMTT